MALYRELSTGFLQEWANNPGLTHQAISAMPIDTIDHRVSWWRGLDTYGQSSDWHPSLPGGAEYPGTDNRAGSGINILPNDYASFEWAGACPPIAAVNASGARTQAAKYHGIYGIRFSASQANGLLWMAPAADSMNITIAPNSKWIVSGYFRPTDNISRRVGMTLRTSAGVSYIVEGSTLANNSSWVRIQGIFDLSGDASTTARLGVYQSSSGVNVDFDALMLEEKVGPLTSASSFNSPWGNGIVTDQFPDYGIPQTKLYQDLGNRIDLIDAPATVLGSVNNRLKITSDDLGSQIATVNLTTQDQALQITQLKTRTTANESFITSLSATTNGQALQITQLQTKDVSHDASITSLNQTTAGQATSIQQLNTTVGQNSSSIEIQAQSIAGLQSQYNVKLDVNGYVTGFGLWNNGAGDSGFLIRADKFAIGFPGTSNKIPFYVDSTGTYMYTAFIKDATIGSAKITDLSVTNAKIANLSVDNAKIANLSVDSIKLADAAVTNAKIANLSVDTAKIANASITDAKIVSLTADKISAGTIDANSITVKNLHADQLTVGTLVTGQITSGAITSFQTGGSNSWTGVTYPGDRTERDLWNPTTINVPSGTRGIVIIEGVVEFFSMGNALSQFPQVKVICGKTGLGSTAFQEYPFHPTGGGPGQYTWTIPFCFTDTTYNVSSGSYFVKISSEVDVQWAGTFKLTEFKR